MKMKVHGQRIRELREERGYSLVDFALKAGISVSYLSEIERGAKKPSLRTLDKIASSLNVPKSQLIEAVSAEGLRLGEKLRLLREEKGLSLSDFAKQCNTSVSYLSEIERGNVYPAVHTIKKIAAELEVPLGILVGQGGSLGQKVRQAREEQGLTQASLAEKAGVSPGLIGQIENGKVQPSLQTIEKLASVLGTSPCYFILDDAGIDDMLLQMNPALKELLSQPEVQSVLRLICNCTEQELQFILNFIKLYKQSGSPEVICSRS